MIYHYTGVMLRPVDICVLLRLTLAGADGRSFQLLAMDLALSASEVHGSVGRAEKSGLLRREGRRRLVNRAGFLEFLEHGLRYAFPVEKGALTRGVPTAFAAEPLRSVLHGDAGPAPVWPHAEGTVRGYAFAPLYKHAPDAALKDKALYELFSLADALRDGRVRERTLALEEVGKRITADG